VGLTSQQHQALLAIKVRSRRLPPTKKLLADSSVISVLLIPQDESQSVCLDIIRHSGWLPRRHFGIPWSPSGLPNCQVPIVAAALGPVVNEVITSFTEERDMRSKPVFEPLQIDTLPVVLGDEIHLQQLLLNLILNGMEAMSESNRRLKICTAYDGKAKVEIAVEDSGPGIPSDRLPRLFDSFFTTKTHGMGLGLSIARSIVEAHGGLIWAENNSSGGACFRFTLPVNGKE
jgi:Histidine kinase-, DNA gyrase B-, and HSP90-like ATPase